MQKILSLLLMITLMAIACQPQSEENSDATAEANGSVTADSLLYPEETHLKNIRQLTFGGNNAEAYFSFDDQYLVFQKEFAQQGIPCDQIYMAKVPAVDEEFSPVRISNGEGRTTCAYFYPSGDTIIYASTKLGGANCPPDVDRSKIRKYVWPIFDTYEIFLADREGNQLAQLTDNDSYDAEATLSPNGDLVVFTSTRNGDLDLYTMKLDGSDVVQVTDGLGYDGGAFFSPDGSKLIFRASRPQTEEAQTEYQELLAQGLVAPTNMELYICNIDGSDLQKITDLGSANWAPFFHPSGEKVIFSSNHASGGRVFNLFMVNLDGSGLEQITHDTEFDAFPMFSFDGTKLVWASNRNNGDTRYTNLFIADWVE